MMYKYMRSVTLVYFLVGLMLIAGSLGCCCGWDRRKCHSRYLPKDCKSLRNIETSIEKLDNGLQSHTRAIEGLKTTMGDKKNESKEIVKVYNINKCEHTSEEKEPVEVIPLKIFIDEKRNDESGLLSIVKGVPTELVAVSDDLVLKIRPEDQQIVDMTLGIINREKNNRRMNLTGKECGGIMITNNRGDKVNVKVVIPLKVLEIGGDKIDKYRPFIVTKCRKEKVIVESDGLKPEIIQDPKELENVEIPEFKENENGEWETTLIAKESAKVSENYEITFENKCGEDEIITVQVE